MEGIQSFEQRTSSEAAYEIDSKRNRIILANRREPACAWSTVNQPISQSGGCCGNTQATAEPAGPINQQRTSQDSSCLARCCRWLSCCWPSSSPGLYRASQHLKSNSSLLSISMQHIDAGPFPSNEWRTSKYTLLNFLPKNLFEQFRRFANFYFLTTAILQIVLPFSPVGPTTSLLPLIFVVATTSIKQAYEDYLRHRMDRELNNRLCHVLRNQKLVKVRSKDIRVGDFVYVKNNEEIPCDMILLAAGGGGGGGGGIGASRVSSPASGGHDKCYVTTANLDGETSLKSRSCFQILEQLGTIQQLEQTLLVVECERPNATLYEFSGNLRVPKSLKAYEVLVGAVAELTGGALLTGGSLRGGNSGKRTVIQGKKSQNFNKNGGAIFGARSADNQKLIAQTIMNQMSKYRSKAEDPNPLHQRQSSSYHEIPLDITNILLRASRLRNTSFVYGLAVYTGRDTKLAQNSQVKPNKFSSTEATVNTFLMIAFMILMTFSLVGTIRYKLLFVPTDAKKQPEPFQEVFVAHFLLYNYLIPISLYVTLEFVKFFGTISVVEDKKMKAMVWRTVAVAPSVDSSTWASRAENGTGLVGDSSKMSIRSRQQRQSEKPKCNSSDLNEELGQVEVLFSDKTGTLTENSMQFKACSIGGSVYRSINEQLYQQPAELYQGPIFKVAHRMAQVRANRSALIGGGAQVASHEGARASSPGGVKRSYHQHRSESSARDKAKPFDHRKFPPLEQLRLVDRMDQQHERVVEFFICLCLCSTITINEQTPLEECLPNLVQEDYDYRSASPDEQSLIEAAHAFGVSMCKSNDRECFIVIEKSLAHRGHQKSKSKSSKSPTTTTKTNLHPRAQGKFRALAEGKNSNDRYIVRHFERLLEFEFSSLRKRMSVIYRDCDNDCLLMVTKGSEELLDCLQIEAGAVENEIDAILTHFEAFAKSGLRTLLVARRLLRGEEFEQILADLREAKLSIQNRDELTTAAYQKAENSLTLIGTTAVEDTLQDGVPETIANLKEAGIKVWLLTGDKVETAISVAYLCKLLDRDMTLFHLVRQQDMQACQRLLASFEHQLSNHHNAPAVDQQHVVSSISQSDPHRVVKSRTASKKSPVKSRSKSPKSPGKPPKSAGSLSSVTNPRSRSSKSSLSGSPPAPPYPLSASVSKSRSECKFALVADGRSLHYAMKYAKEELAKLCKQCSCVLGCRLSPLQKAEVVDMIKQSDESPITAAIGDGANDVSMIQEAHVGIGISGKEGKQAVNCSDFAIGRFQMLNRLFFVHGHLFYHRTANIIHYFFYKNFLFILPQFLYSCYNLSSTRSLYHPVLLIGFNLFFTSLPVLVYGLLEVNVPEQALESCPKFYTANRANSQLRVSVFFAWLLLATIQGLLGFYLLQSTLSHLLESGSRQHCINAFAVILYFAIILTVTVRLYFAAYSHNLYLNLATLVSLISLPGLLYAYSLVDLQSVISDNSLHKQVQLYLAAPMFWFAIGTLTLITVLPDLLWLARDRILHLKWIRSTIRENHLASR